MQKRGGPSLATGCCAQLNVAPCAEQLEVALPRQQAIVSVKMTYSIQCFISSCPMYQLVHTSNNVITIDWSLML